MVRVTLRSGASLRGVVGGHARREAAAFTDTPSMRSPQHPSFSQMQHLPQPQGPRECRGIPAARLGFAGR